MKKIVIVLLALMINSETTPYYGYDHHGHGGGYAAAGLGGFALGAALSSRGHDRGPEYYEHKDRRDQRREVNKQIREHNKSISSNNRQIRKHNKSLRKIDSGSDEAIHHNNQIKSLQNENNEHKESILDLKDELRTI